MAINITQLRFFRNTHLGPEFKVHRPDLDEALAEAAPVDFEPCKGASGWVFHLLDHIQGMTFLQLLEEARQYNLQHNEEPIVPDQLWAEIKACLKDTTIRVEI